MFVIEAIPAVAYGLFALGLPESPRYLVSKEKFDEASRVLYRFTGELDVNLKIEQIRDSLHREKRESLRDLLGDRLGLQPIMWVGILLAALQQLLGINVIFYYSTTLWQSVGFDESQAFLTSTITSAINILATIVAIVLVDRVGRRPMLLVGSAGTTISLATMAVAFSFSQGSGQDVTLPDPWSTVALIAANAFVVFFATTWGPIMWVMLGEMFPNRIRASALAVAGATQWAANFLVSTTFPAMSQIGLTLAYGVYAFFGALSFLFVLRLLPETKGRELEEMDDLQTGPARRSHQDS